MKAITLLAFLLLFTSAYSQSGVYLSADDYINHKLTDECQSLSVPSKPGENDVIVLLTKNGRKTYLFSEVWGYKNGHSEYRILQGKPHLIACKGNIYALTPYGPILQKGKKVIYYRYKESFGAVTITKDISDLNPSTYTDYTELWKQFDSTSVKDLKDYYIKLIPASKGYEVAPEHIINYYNSTRPGYIPPVYTEIEVRPAYE